MRHPSGEFTISYSPEKEPMQKLDLITSAMAGETSSGPAALFTWRPWSAARLCGPPPSAQLGGVSPLVSSLSSSKGH